MAKRRKGGRPGWRKKKKGGNIWMTKTQEEKQNRGGRAGRAKTSKGAQLLNSSPVKVRAPMNSKKIGGQ